MIRLIKKCKCGIGTTPKLERDKDNPFYVTIKHVCDNCGVECGQI